MYATPALLADDHFQVSGLVEELLDRRHVAVEFVVSFGILVLHFHHLSEVGQGVERVVDAGTAVPVDRLDHLVPQGRGGGKHEVELRGIPALRHLHVLVDLEGDSVQRVANARAEPGVAVSELLEDVVVLLGQLLERPEELEGREANRHPVSPWVALAPTSLGGAQRGTEQCSVSSIRGTGGPGHCPGTPLTGGCSRRGSPWGRPGPRGSRDRLLPDNETPQHFPRQAPGALRLEVDEGPMASGLKQARAVALAGEAG